MERIQFLRGFSLCLFLLSLAQPAFTLGSLPPGILKLDLAHLDFGSLTNATQAQKMQVAVERSGRRLSYFQKLVSAKASESVASPGEFETQISAAPGAFITTITIGTPGVRVPAIVDTGSSVVWQQCEPCENCYSQTDPIFQPSKSISYKRALCGDPLCKALPSFTCGPDSSCQYVSAYGDGSSSKGDFSYDTLTLKDTSGSNVTIRTFGFGCGHDNEGSSFSGAGGLIGLGQNSVSLALQLSSPTFSYCLQSISDSASQTSPLFLGSGASFGGSSNLLSTPFIKNPVHPSRYYIGLKGISVGGTPLNIIPGTFDINPVDGTGGIIIDSGTTLTYLDEAGYGPLLQAFESETSLSKADGSGTGLDLCYDLPSGKGPIEVPTLTFHFDGADLDLPADNYFVAVDNLLCLAIAGSRGLSIFGNIQQQNYHILYDLANQRLSIANATCDQL